MTETQLQPPGARPKVAQKSSLSNAVNEILIPAALIMGGTAIVKRSLVPFAVAFTAIVLTVKYLLSRPRAALDPKNFKEFELEDVYPVSHNTNIYRFKLPRPQDVLGLPVGQHISAQAIINGKTFQRSYTPISKNDDQGHFDLMIKSYPEGNISKYFDTLKVGQTMSFRGPKGKMVYRPGLCRELGLIAGGTGITPMLQLIRAVIENENDSTICHLIYANVTEDDILLKKEIDAIAANDNRLKVHYVLDNPPANWTGSAGFVNADIIRKHCPKPGDDVKLCICGPPPMVKYLRHQVKDAGFKTPNLVSKLDDQVFVF